MAKILIVEDEVELAEKLRDWLMFEKHIAEVMHDGAEALAALKLYDYDLIILDLNLPTLSGMQICTEYRSSGGRSPILMLTGRKDISDKERGLDVGADDYLTKPFDTRELSARVRTLLRRPATFTGTILQAGDIALDPTSHRVTKRGEEIQLQPLEFALLEFQMRHPNQVYSPDTLLNRVWGTHSEAAVDTLRTYIKTLRKKIDEDGQPSLVQTVFGVGYRLVQ